MDEAGAVVGDAAPAWRSTKRSGRRLVCVSGLDGAANEWAGVGSALARYGDVFTVELALRDPQSCGPLQAEGEAIVRVLADATERSMLIGHSMGSVVSLLVAAAQPDRLAGLVLTAPFLPLARDGRSTLVTAADYARHRVLFAAGARGRRRQRTRHTVNRRARVAGLRALAHYGVRPEAFHAIADRVSCPVLLVHGSEDHYVPPSFALAAAARHPAWRLALITGAGHFPHRDNPAAWITSVEPWLQRLQPRAG
jgi:pimeloyl-ACP methyl ester carboxylesterase